MEILWLFAEEVGVDAWVYYGDIVLLRSSSRSAGTDRLSPLDTPGRARGRQRRTASALTHYDGIPTNATGDTLEAALHDLIDDHDPLSCRELYRPWLHRRRPRQCGPALHELEVRIASCVFARSPERLLGSVAI